MATTWAFLLRFYCALAVSATIRVILTKISNRSSGMGGLTNCIITPQVPTDETGALSLSAIVALLVPAGVKKMASMRTIDDCGLHPTPCVSKSELKHLYIVNLTPMA